MPADGDAGPTPFPTTEQLRRINHEFVAMVRSWFPRKFYGRTAQHQAFVGAALLRMCDTLDDLMLLMTHPGPSDQGARVLLRSLYEQAIRLSWVLIDQRAHHPQWVGHAQNELLTIHNCLLSFGETYLSPALLADVQGAKDMPPVEQMTREADSYWAPKVPGLHPRAKPKKQQKKKRSRDSVPETPEHPTDSEPMLSFEGLYQTIYRTTSHSVHGSLNSLEGYVDLEGPWPVAGRSEEPLVVVYALGAPVLGIALMVAGQRFPWIDQDRVRRFVDRIASTSELETRMRSRRRRRGGPAYSNSSPAYAGGFGIPVVMLPDLEKDYETDPGISAIWTEFGNALGRARRVLVLGHFLHDEAPLRSLADHAPRSTLAVTILASSENPSQPASEEAAAVHARVLERLPGASVLPVRFDGSFGTVPSTIRRWVEETRS